MGKRGPSAGPKKRRVEVPLSEATASLLEAKAHARDETLPAFLARNIEKWANPVEKAMSAATAPAPAATGNMRPRREYRVEPKDCRHPAGNRFGKFCALCGKDPV